jgi:YD repeat-containing protein
VPAVDNFINPTGGNWDVPSNWSTGSVPGPGDSAVINTDTPATVLIQPGDLINVLSLTTGSNDTLSVLGGSLTVTSGTSTLSGPFEMQGGTVEAAGGATMQDNSPIISVPLPPDRAPVKLSSESLQGNGKGIKDVTLDFTKTDKGKLEVYLKFLLNNAAISGVSTSSAGEQPQESFSLNFSKQIATKYGGSTAGDWGVNGWGPAPATPDGSSPGASEISNQSDAGDWDTFSTTATLISTSQSDPTAATTAGGNDTLSLNSSIGFDYYNTLEAMPAPVSYRPARQTRPPVIQGVKSALTVSVPDADLNNGKFGAVNAQFFWDRAGAADGSPSCWMRTSEVWAGKNWGFIANPRIGQEVLVDFLNGDLDNPVVTGRFYDAQQMPPYQLPARPPQQINNDPSAEPAGSAALEATSVTAPTTAGPGQAIKVNLQAMNSSGNDASGEWQDSVYLSPTPAIDSSSTLLGAVAHSGGLSAWSSYSSSLTTALPAVEPGAYYLLVQVDSLYQVPQADRTSNTLADSEPLDITVPSLTLRTPLSDTFTAADQDHYYQVNVPACGALAVSLASAAGTGANSLYVSEGSLPTPYNYEFAANVANQPNQSLTVPQVLAPGTYYILAHSVSGDAATAGFTLTATPTIPPASSDQSTVWFNDNGVGYHFVGGAGNDVIGSSFANDTENIAGVVTDTESADSGPVIYHYNHQGLVTQKTFADGSTQTFTYDAQANLVTASTFDAAGTPTGTSTLTYNAANEPALITYPDGKFLDFTYDSTGQLTQSVDQSGYTLNYAEDSLGRPYQITDGSGNLILQYAYNALGQVTQKLNGDGTYADYSYDANGNLTGSLGYAAAGTASSSFSVTAASPDWRTAVMLGGGEPRGEPVGDWQTFVRLGGGEPRGELVDWQTAVQLGGGEPQGIPVADWQTFVRLGGGEPRGEPVDWRTAVLLGGGQPRGEPLADWRTFVQLGGGDPHYVWLSAGPSSSAAPTNRWGIAYDLLQSAPATDLVQSHYSFFLQRPADAPPLAFPASVDSSPPPFKYYIEWHTRVLFPWKFYPLADTDIRFSGHGYTLTVTKGSLPPGITLDFDKTLGLPFVGGSPTEAGTYDFTITATDSIDGHKASETYLWVVVPLGPSFARADSTGLYTDLFHNDGSTTARDVTVTQQLDANLDWSTFQLSSFGLGALQVNVPPGLTQYQTTVAYQNADGSPLEVRVGMDFNVQTGLLTANFTSLDAATGEAPAGAGDGFLPPDDTSGIGEGFLQYNVQPKTGLAPGVTITQQPEYTYDVSGRVTGDAVTNPVDVEPPISVVASLPPVSQTAAIPVSWSGTDYAGGPGIADYSIYVSDNGGSFTPWLLDTTDKSATFLGQYGHTYGFYSVATDIAGYREAAPTAAQATTTVAPLSLILKTPATVGAGQTFLVTVKVLDAAGNIPVAQGSRFGVYLSTTNPEGNVPSEITLTGNMATFPVMWQKASGAPWSISAVAQVSTGNGRFGVLIASAPITVTPGPACGLEFVQQPGDTPTGVPLAPVSVAVIDQYGNVVSSDNTDVVILSANFTRIRGTFAPITYASFTADSTFAGVVQNGVVTFDNLAIIKPGTYQLSATVPDRYTSPYSTPFNVAPLQVLPGSLAGIPWGFTVEFNAPVLVNTATPLLYGQGYGASAPVPSVTLTRIGDASGRPIVPVPIEGSLVLHAGTGVNSLFVGESGRSGADLIFVATNTAGVVNNGTPILPDGTYVARLKGSGATGLQALRGGGFLDGLGTGIAGSGDFTATFTINAQAAGQDIVWVPDVAEGPGQTLNAPGMNRTGGGYPVYLDDSTGSVTDVQVTLNYDPTLLNVTGVSGPGFSLLASSTPGQAVLEYHGPALPTGKQTPIGCLMGAVPSGSAANPMPYRAEDFLHLSDVSLNGGSTPVTTSDGLHLVAYVGDAAGTGNYSTNDAVLITRVALQTDTGFAAWPRTDPVMVGDTSGAGFMPSDVALQVNEASIGIPTANLSSPPIPSGVIFQIAANASPAPQDRVYVVYAGLADNSGSSVSAITVIFNEAVNSRTLTPATVQILAPGGGSIPMLTIVDIAPPSVGASQHNVFQIQFAPQTACGMYTITLAPQITDMNGNGLDQDRDGSGGAAPGDAFSGSFLFGSVGCLPPPAF